MKKSQTLNDRVIEKRKTIAKVTKKLSTAFPENWDKSNWRNWDKWSNKPQWPSPSF